MSGEGETSQGEAAGADLDPFFRDGRPVLVTGGRGFLGSHVALRLAAKAPEGAVVVCVDDGTRDCYAALGIEPPPALRFVRGDVREPQRWLPELPGAPSVVVHCAALAGVSTYYRDPFSVLEVNGIGTYRLARALMDEPPALFVNLSTSEVYGRDAEAADEAGPTPVGPVSNPRWSYASSKVFAEHLLFAAARRDGLPVLSLRPFNVYGPGQMGEGAVRIFAERALAGQVLDVTGDGSQRRAWLYVDDFVDALLTLVGTPSAWGRTYNVGNSATLVSMAQLAERMAALAGSEAGVRFVPHPGQDVRERWPRTDAIEQACGWTPAVDLDEGLRRTLDFWRSQARDNSS